jgi:hypothetical protein
MNYDVFGLLAISISNAEHNDGENRLIALRRE